MPPKVKTLFARSVSLIVYLLMGGWIFQRFEADNQFRNIQTYEALIANFCKKYDIPRHEMTKLEVAILKGERNETTLRWNYGNAVIFSGTTILTVGYGNFIPKTVEGKGFCIAYAVFGIPLACITLKSLGEQILIITGHFLKFISRIGSKASARSRIHFKTAVLNLFLTIIVILSCGYLATFKRKDWNYFECVYFVFITISTIGFGDYVPQYGDEKTAFDILSLLIGFLLGFSVMSSFLCSVSNAMEESGLGKIFDAAHVLVQKKVLGAEKNMSMATDTTSCEKATNNGKDDNTCCEKDSKPLKKPSVIIHGSKECDDKECNEKTISTADERANSDVDNFLGSLSREQSRQSSIVSLGVVKI